MNKHAKRMHAFGGFRLDHKTIRWRYCNSDISIPALDHWNLERWVPGVESPPLVSAKTGHIDGLIRLVLAKVVRHTGAQSATL